MCPNCDEKLAYPDLCEICYWEPGDDLAEPEPDLGLPPSPRANWSAAQGQPPLLTAKAAKKAAKPHLRAAKARRQEKEWEEVKGCLPVLAVGIAIVAIGLVLHGCETRANLDDANHKGAVLERSKADGNTIWPDGFDPVAAGVIFED